MKIIVGLGNPGEKYKTTRHNAGFLAIDYSIANSRFKIEDLRFNKKFNSEILDLGHLDTDSDNSDYILVKPQTFMNNSGQAVAEIVNFYKIDPAKDLLVIHDDVDLPLGTIRANGSSSSAGHNGVQDIIDKLGTQNFHRIRIGVESRTSREGMPTEAFVLQNFNGDELKKLYDGVLPNAKLEIEKFIGNLKLEI